MQGQNYLAILKIGGKAIESSLLTQMENSNFRKCRCKCSSSHTFTDITFSCGNANFLKMSHYDFETTTIQLFTILGFWFYFL